MAQLYNSGSIFESDSSEERHFDNNTFHIKFNYQLQLNLKTLSWSGSSTCTIVQL